MILIMFSHWVADFLCQARYIAEGKGKNNWILFLHCVIYSLVMFFGASIMIGFIPAAIFAGINFILHFIVDYFTSRISSKFYKSGNTYLFFSTIGFDQFLHTCCLYITFGGLNA